MPKNGWHPVSSGKIFFGVTEGDLFFGSGHGDEEKSAFVFVLVVLYREEVREGKASFGSGIAPHFI